MSEHRGYVAAKRHKVAIGRNVFLVAVRCHHDRKFLREHEPDDHERVRGVACAFSSRAAHERIAPLN